MKTISKSAFFCALSASLSIAHAQLPVSVGAIRWDVWYQNPEINQFNPFPQNGDAWAERLPFFSIIDSAGKFQTPNNIQQVVDLENEYATKRGIDYWAFNYNQFRTINYCTGSKPSSYNELTNPYQRVNYRLSEVMSLYHASALLQKPKYALIIGSGGINAFVNEGRTSANCTSTPSREQAWRMILNDLKSELSKGALQKSNDGRPMLFIHEAEKWASIWSDNSIEAKQKIEDLKNLTVGIPGYYSKKMYVVAMNGDVSQSFKLVNDLGFDSISVYALAPSGEPGKESSQKKIADTERWFLSSVAGQNVHVIPSITTSWDPRPLVGYDPTRPANPEWVDSQSTDAWIEQFRYATSFVRDNWQQSKANTVLLYAWNELAEGGYLVPTLLQGSAKLDRLAQAKGIPISPVGSSLAPYLDRAGSGCDNNMGIWIIGARFSSNGFVLLSKPTLNRYEAVSVYRPREFTLGKYGNEDAISFCLRTDTEKSLFSTVGLRINYVNLDTQKNSNSLLLKRS